MGELYKIIEPDFCYKDERGELVQLFHEGWKQVNIIKSKLGTTRGEHYHSKTIEGFYVISGKVEVILKETNKIKKIKMGPNDFFVIKPMVLHSLRFLSDCIMLGIYDNPIELDDGSKDILN